MALVWSQPLIFPPRHERLGVREHTRPRVGSTSRALLEHRWYIVGMKLASCPLQLAKPLLQKAYTRDAYASMSRYLSRPRRKYFILLFLIQFWTDRTTKLPLAFDP